MPKIKASELWAEVQKIAAERPDHVYEPPYGSDCVYMHNGEPSCIVGQGFARLGLAPERFDDIEENSVEGIFEDEWGLFSELVESDDPDAVSCMEVAQARQDAGKPWGEAVFGLGNVPALRRDTPTVPIPPTEEDEA